MSDEIVRHENLRYSPSMKITHTRGSLVQSEFSFVLATEVKELKSKLDAHQKMRQILVTKVCSTIEKNQGLRSQIAFLQQENDRLRRLLVAANLNVPTDAYNWDDDSLPNSPEGPVPSS